MTPLWTRQDLLAWRHLVRCGDLALQHRMARGRFLQADVGDLRHSLKRTLSAVPPTNDPAGTAKLIAWRRVVESVVTNPESRDALTAAMTRGCAAAKIILALTDRPPPPPAAAAAMGGRLPYRDD